MDAKRQNIYQARTDKLTTNINTDAAGLQVGNNIMSAYIVDCYPRQVMSVIAFYPVILSFSSFINPVSFGLTPIPFFFFCAAHEKKKIVPCPAAAEIASFCSSSQSRGLRHPGIRGPLPLKAPLCSLDACRFLPPFTGLARRCAQKTAPRAKSILSMSCPP